MFRKGLQSIAFVALAVASHAQAPTSWKSVGVGGGGAFFAPTFNPKNTSELTLACDMSGQYHSTDAGVSWNLTPFTNLQVGPNSPQVQYTSDPNTVYMVDTTGDNLTPVKSMDGGKTYAPLANDPTGQGAFYLFSDPTTTTRLIVSSYDTLYYSGDGGATWKTIATGPGGNGIVVSSAYFNGTQIIIGTSLGILGSSNGGTSFSFLTGQGIPSTEQIVTSAVSKAGAVTRIAVVTLGAGDVYGGIGGADCDGYQGIYTFDLGTSTSWTKRVTGIPSGAHPFFIGMGNGNVNNIYVAGGSDAGTPIIYKSVNGGQTWASMLNVTNNTGITTGWQGYHGDRDWSYDELVFGFQVCPTDVNRVAFTGFGFCHVTTNGGQTWHQVYVIPASQNIASQPTPKNKAYIGNGLENTSSWWVTWSDINNVFTSSSDIKGIRSTTAGTSWSFNYTGQNLNSTYQSTIGPTGTLYVATSSIHDMYESTHLLDSRFNSGSGGVLQSVDKGLTWTPLGSLNHVVMGVALDPTNAKRMFATVANGSVGGVYVCNDITLGASAVWTKCPAPTRTVGHAFNVSVLKDGTVVTTFSGQLTSGGAFTNTSGVFVSTDHGQTWADRSAPNMHWWTRDLTVDPTDTTQKTWYVGVFSGWGGTANNRGGVYRTKDRGVTWTELIQSDRVGSIAINPKNANELYFTTETEGLWYSSNATLASPTFTQVTSYPFRQPERVFFNPYKAAEVWVTSFGNGLRIGTKPPMP